MRALTREYNELKRRGFDLQFRYPSAQERENLRIIHRDMSQEELQHIESRNRDLGKLISSIECGDVRTEDLDSGARARLIALLEKSY